jgi:methionine sulfoxide reductase heme-binding subunit
VNVDTFLWILARITGLTSATALAISLLTGLALRSAVLDWLATNRAVRATHEFTAVLWIPTGLFHVVLLLLDHSVRSPIGLADVFVPFRVGYGAFAIGLGTVSLDLFVLVALTGWLRRSMPAAAWRWIHRLSYPACAMVFLHALLGGSDFSTNQVSAIAWAVAAILAVLSGARIVWGRLSSEGRELPRGGRASS